jgi:hypothetical protein
MLLLGAKLFCVVFDVACPCITVTFCSACLITVFNVWLLLRTVHKPEQLQQAVGTLEAGTCRLQLHATVSLAACCKLCALHYVQKEL